MSAHSSPATALPPEGEHEGEQQATSPTLSTKPTIAPVAELDVEPPAEPDAESDMDETPQEQHPRYEFGPGCQAAIFSTQLCSREKRPAGPQYRPVIVRGNGDEGVMEAARYWQKKFKWQCLCIFPCHGWTIYDLWDAADLHLDSHQFLFNVMKFIERDNYFAGRRFAEDWMLAHPDDVEFVVQTKINQDNEHPLRIVEAIFIYGEPLDFPRVFLYHVVNLIVIARDLRLAAVSGQEQQISNEVVPGSVAEDVQEALGSTETAPAEQESEKARKHIHATTSSEVPGVTATASTSGGPSAGIGHSKDHGAKPKRTADRGTCTTMMSPGNTHTQTMKAPREVKPENTMGPTYSPSNGTQPLPTGGWVENKGRVLPPPPGLSGQYFRHPSGPASNLASPPMYPTATMAGIPTVYPPNLYQLYPHGNHMMPSNMSLYQHFDPTSNQAGIFPFHPNPMHGGYMYQAPMHQPHQGSPGMRGVSMGNITNHMPYAANMGPQYGESSRGPTQRRSSNLNTSGSLFDPYEGTNTRFNNAAGQGMGRNFSQGASAYQGGRPHRPSAPGNRPFRAHLPYIKQMEDDTKITRNYRTGCDVTWIGPDNQTVDELYVDYLPEGIKAEELKQLFEVQTGVTPWSIDIRNNKDPGTFLNACSAFVRFSSTADAKQALTVRDQNNHIRGGALAVGVTVPKKFYQRLVEYNKPEVRQGPIVHTQFFARGDPHAPTQQRGSYTKPRYSPQDARSGLQKKTTQDSAQGPEGKTSARDESPDARKPHRHQKAPQAQAVTMEPSKEAAPASGKVVDESKDNTVGNESSQVALDPASPKTGTTKVETRVNELVEPEKSDKETFQFSSTIAAVEVAAPETSASNTVTATPQITTTPPVTAAPSIITASTGSPVIDNKTSPEVTTIAAPKVTDTPNTAEVMPPKTSTTHATSSKSNTEESKSEPPQKRAPHRKKAPKVKVPGSAAEGARSGESSSKALEARPKQASTAAPDELVAQAITQAPISTPELAAPDAKDMIDTSSQPAQVSLANEPTTAAPKHENRQDSVDDEQIVVPAATAIEDSIESGHFLTPPAAIEGFITDPAPSSPAPARLVPDNASVSRVANRDEASSAGALAASETAFTTELAQDTIDRTSEKMVDTSAENAKAVPTTSLTAAVEPKKKLGAQKSESYFPFAKGSKTQQKKEKEMKKKQQKKAELEKAEQAKAGKAQVDKAQVDKAESSTKQNDTVQAKASAEPPQSPNKAGVETGGIGMPPKCSKRSKGKGKATIATKADQSEGLDIDPGQNGKLEAADTNAISNDPGSEVPKVESTQTLETEPTRSISPPTGSSDAQSPEKEIKAHSQEKSDGASESATPMLSLPSNHAQSSSKKQKQQIPAVPNLNLKSHKPSPSIQVSQRSIKSPSNSAVNFESPEKDCTSITSSATLQTEELAVMSPSPTTPEFRSAVQTPITPAPQAQAADALAAKFLAAEALAALATDGQTAEVNVPGEEPPKKKKKKSKKKKKKAAAGPTETTDVASGSNSGKDAAPQCESGSDDDLYDPFSSQLKHIDAIKKSLKNPDSYYSQVNARMAAEAETEADKPPVHPAVARGLISANLLQQLDGYLKENGMGSVSNPRLARKDDK